MICGCTWLLLRLMQLRTDEILPVRCSPTNSSTHLDNQDVSHHQNLICMIRVWMGRESVLGINIIISGCSVYISLRLGSRELNLSGIDYSSWSMNHSVIGVCTWPDVRCDHLAALCWSLANFTQKCHGSVSFPGMVHQRYRKQKNTNAYPRYIQEVQVWCPHCLDPRCFC